MSRVNLPHVGVGNDFIIRPQQPRLGVVSPAAAPASPAPAVPVAAASMPLATPAPALDEVSFEFEKSRGSLLYRLIDIFHQYSLGIFAILLLIVGSSAIEVGSVYLSAHIGPVGLPQHASLRIPRQPAQGPNMTVAAAQTETAIQRITTQPLNLVINDKNIAVSPDMIKSWLQVAADKSKTVSYIHVDQNAINKSLNEAAKPYIKAPVNQVETSNPDGSKSVLSAGKNGATLGDITPLTQQVTQSLLGAKGMRLKLPVETQAFAVVSPSAFDKMIEVNVTTKQMYLYEKGNLVKQYPISAGAPATPTPIGQFQIYSKLAVQDMRGFNANGTRYFQPRVRWINYFLPGGFAVHGVYWHGQSWFGNINSSHGCVGLPDDQAKEVYDWAPLGTTVITHP